MVCVADSSSGSLKVLTAAGNIDAYVGHDGTADLHTQEGTTRIKSETLFFCLCNF